MKYKIKIKPRARGYYFNGRYHREDGPAIEWTDGAKYWYLNGKYHCEDGFNARKV